MSKHWPPGDKIAPIGAGRRNWARPSSYVAPRVRRGGARSPGPSGVVVGVVLAAAACAGIAVGLSQGRAERGNQPSAAIERDAVQAAPRGELSPEDRAWAGRATRPGRTGDAGSGWAPDQVRGDESGVRRAFGLCHSGGGTNCVVDGDTFYIGGDKVRIAGIDAPETHPPRCAEEAQLGDAATTKLRALLNSGAVTMTSIDRDLDVYGRLLRNVQVDGVDVGEAMVGAGVARDYAGGRRSWC